MQDNCMWACTEGYYRSGDTCEACNVDACPAPMVREVCTKGFSRDARCICPMDHFIIATENGVACERCERTSCEDPTMETFVRCNGATEVDISRCVRNVVEG